MAYATQPGTFPHRVVEWLRRKPDGFECSTAEIAAAMDFDMDAVAPCLVNARKHGALATRKVARPHGVMLLWRLGDGRPEQRDPAVAAYDARVEAATQGKRNDLVPPQFRALEWEGKLLVTGMQIVDGVAVFEPHQVLQLKRHTDWWRASA
jgi:hypothetical protein